MKRTEKQEIIEDLYEKFGSYSAVYIIDHNGMSVKDIDIMRRVVHSEGMYMKVVKNTFIKKAAEKHGDTYDSIYDTLHGVSSLMFSNVANMPAKLIKKVKSTVGSFPVLKGAYIEGCFYLGGDENLSMLAQLKSKEELIGDVISLLQSPIRNVISGLKKSSSEGIHSILKALASR